MWNPNRAARRYPKLILAQRVNGGKKIVARIESGVPQEFPCRTMKGIASALGDHIDDSSRYLTELRQVIVRLHFELLDGVYDRGIIVVADKGEIIHAVHIEHVAA